MKRKALMLILGLTLSAISFSSCGGDKKETKPESPQNVEAQDVESTEDTQTDDADEPNKENSADESDESEQNDNEAENTEATEDKLAQFFDNSVLTGDSISKHFGNYITKNPDALPGKMKLLSEGSFSLHNAKGEPTADSTFPMYQGEKMKIEDAIAKMGVKNVFMFYGINDLGLDTPDECLKLYDEQINKIMEQSPDAKIFIISPTYLHKDKAHAYKKLNNDNIKAFNDLLVKYCDDTGRATYIDLATKLQDEDGNLKDEYCNDNYCHHTEKAFEIWVSVLVEQAKKEVSGQ